MAEIRKEFKNFIEDLDKNIKNKDDLEYVKNRTSVFMNAVLDYVDFILKYKEDKITTMEKIQSELEKKMNMIEEDIAEIQQDLYIEGMEDFNGEDLQEMQEAEKQNEEDYDTEIVCPYCESEFLVDLSQELNEVQCPECNNIIELDWTGNMEDNSNSENNCGDGNCSKCPGCPPMDDKTDDDM